MGPGLIAFIALGVAVLVVFGATGCAVLAVIHMADVASRVAGHLTAHRSP